MMGSSRVRRPTTRPPRRPLGVTWRYLMAVAAAIGISAAIPQTGLAQHDHRGGGHHSGGHGGGTRGAHGWHGGHWQHGWHGSRLGWWWVAPNLGWYAYDQPVYPAPNPYVPPGAAPGYWYYCPSPAGYYPYVAQCMWPWQPVVPPG